MKTISRRLMLSLATVVLGISGAFVTTSMGSATTAADQRGYRFVDEDHPCVEDIMCSNTFNTTICSSGGSQLWGKANPSINNCEVTLYKKLTP
jgi:hypothetical protein